jgi:hypothetical protein
MVRYVQAAFAVYFIEILLKDVFNHPIGYRRRSQGTTTRGLYPFVPILFAQAKYA